MVARNPFLVTSPIYTDADFVGRESDLRRLFEVVSGPQPQSLCIYGERRIGKSSLLHAFERRAAATLSPADRYLVLSYDIAQAATPGELVLQLIERELLRRSRYTTLHARRSPASVLAQGSARLCRAPSSTMARAAHVPHFAHPSALQAPQRRHIRPPGAASAHRAAY